MDRGKNVPVLLPSVPAGLNYLHKRNKTPHRPPHRSAPFLDERYPNALSFRIRSENSGIDSSGAFPASFRIPSISSVFSSISESFPSLFLSSGISSGAQDRWRLSITQSSTFGTYPSTFYRKAPLPEVFFIRGYSIGDIWLKITPWIWLSFLYSRKPFT